MAIVIPEGSELGLSLVRENVPPLLGATLALESAEESASMRVAPPYPVYTVGLTSVLEGRLLASARLTAWQYVVFTGDSAVGVAEVAVGTAETAPPLSYAALHSERYSGLMLETMAYAEKLTKDKDGDYELRILRGPSLTLLAVWLHGDDDLLIPIRPARKVIKKRRTRVVSEAELTDALRPLAMTRLNATDR